MRFFVAVIVCSVAILVFARVASAQQELVVADRGTIYATYFLSTLGTTITVVNGPFTAGGTGLNAGLTSTTVTSPVPGIAAFLSQAVIEFRTSTIGGSPITSVTFAYVVFHAANATGTWALLAHTIDDGSVNASDAFLGPASFSTVGTTTFGTGVGGQSFAFDITPHFTADLGGTGFSGYTLVHIGPPSEVIPTALPEPGTLALFGLGLMTFAVGHHIRRKRKQG